ncbi:hypothetical protein [Sediminibacterium goheungense]|uniref:Lipoprotein n=1 Tax=Sediminibacterium goheungense TaxID=1086393 RepID=A0A4R6IWI2_9BACT|nr:hypothetical protein [Sediminibacterium goheungense]TDO27062.1 hypothetical protein BC659_2379 [Sediminibacterium goheungense]
MKAERMKAKLLILSAIILGISACKKDTYTTRPQLTFKSVNGKVFGSNSAILFSIEFTDKEGDVQDSIWVQKISKVNGCNNFSDRAKIPSFTATSNLKGVFEVGYSVGFVPGSNYTVIPTCSKNDTCYFRFWTRDKAKNQSDTVVSPDIIIIK